MSKKYALTAIILISAVLFVIVGCERDPLDQIQIGRFRPTPVVNVILDSLGVAEEEEPRFIEAQEPKPIDLLELDQDYILSPGDYITVYIFELLEETVPYEKVFEISESGNISIPEVGNVQAAGLTEVQLEEEIKEILSPTILKSPSVTIKLENSPSRTFTILGEGLPQPGRYQLPSYAFRLADALAQAGSPRQFNVSYIYITRYDDKYHTSSSLPSPKPAVNNSVNENTSSSNTDTSDDFKLIPVEPIDDSTGDNLLEIIAPNTSKNNKSRQASTVISASNAASLRELQDLATPEEIALDELQDYQEQDLFYDESVTEGVKTQPDNTVDTVNQEPAKTEWIFQDGKWITVKAEPQSADNNNNGENVTDNNGNIADNQAADYIPKTASVSRTRVIKIPVKRLGIDPKYNVVIRAGDIVTVPFNVVGEAVVMGNVNRPGYIDLTGRPMTLMQAIAAAGGLSELAEPSRVEVRRRIGEDREEIVMVNLDKIARGLQPDFFIREDDTINVGTLPSARFAAVLRNAFRATYGFGFIYDRNFADRDFLTRRPIPSIF